MADHPIEALMKTAMESIKEMVDVNTVVGDPVEAPDGSVIIPISRVTCGFAAGGSEFEAGNGGGGEGPLPFGGGSGAGVSVHPMGFLVVGNNQVRLLPVEGNQVMDRVLDLAPQVVDKIHNMLKKNDKNAPSEEETEKWQGGV
ncbi:MAG: GerW family sporulation protein [Bacillota bacterium]|nr:GerW family sporulation protein [Bacillota bacterium]